MGEDNTFLSENTRLPSQKLDAKTRRPLRSAIRAVVLSGGDAFPQGFDNMRKLLHDEFTDLCDGPTIDGLDPAYVLAYGGARTTKQSIVYRGNEGTVFGGRNSADWFQENSGEEPY